MEETKKPQCPKCKGAESPHSVEKESENTWKCHECRTVFEPVKMGRPSLGVTKKVSLTLSDEAWAFIETVKHDQDMNQSEALRYIIEQSMSLSKSLLSDC